MLKKHGLHKTRFHHQKGKFYDAQNSSKIQKNLVINSCRYLKTLETLVLQRRGSIKKYEFNLKPDFSIKKGNLRVEKLV